MSELIDIDRLYNTQCAWQEWEEKSKKAIELGHQDYVTQLQPIQGASCEAIELQTLKLEILIDPNHRYKNALDFLNEEQLAPP